MAAILTVFISLSVYYAIGNPLFSKPDEVYHYAYALHLRSTGELPRVDVSHSITERRAEAEFEAHQPPLYYTAVALISSPFAASPKPLPAANPHFLATEFGNRNPWTPTYVSSPQDLPVFFAGRFTSVLFGAAALLFSYFLLRQYLPWPTAVLAVAFVGLNPQFLFISSSFSNDMAGVATVNLGLWQIGVGMQRGLTLRRGLALGLVIAVATMAKLGGLGLIVLVATLGVSQSWKARQLRPALWASVSAATLVTIDLWWFWRNWNLYGDPFAVTVLPMLIGSRPESMGLDELFGLFEFLWKAYWLDFSPGGILFAETAVYYAIGGVCAVAGLGFLALFIRDEGIRPLAMLVWGWFALVLVSLLRLTSATAIFMGGGRLLFPAASAGAVTLALGLTEVARGRRYLPIAVACGLGLFAVIAPHAYLDPAYPRPSIRYALEQQPLIAAGVRFGEDLCELVGYDLELRGQGSGPQHLEITYYWRALKGTDHNLSVFVQLLDEGGRKLAQLDTYPGYGSLPTSFWRSGQMIVDRLHLPLPSVDGVTAGRIMTGLYDLSTGKRIRAVDPNGQEIPGAADSVARIARTKSGQIKLLAPNQAGLEHKPSHPSGARFGKDEIELLGYDVELVNLDGQQRGLDVTYYWRTLQGIDRDLTVFLQLVSQEKGQPTVRSQLDTYPGYGAFPTSRWTPNRVVTDRLCLPLPSSGEPANGQVITGLYYLPSLERLPVVDLQGRPLPDSSLPIAEICDAPGGQRQLFVQGHKVAETGGN